MPRLTAAAAVDVTLTALALTLNVGGGRHDGRIDATLPDAG